MNEIDNDLVMDARKWIEFGKMFNNMIQDGWEVDIETSVIDDYNTTYSYFVYDVKEDETYANHYFKSPYLAIKEVYFHYFLNQKSNEDVSIDLDKDLEDRLYALADKEGITIDEVVANVLKAEPILKEYADCCYNCSHVKELEEISPYCTKLSQRTEREYTCRYFTP